MGIRFHGAAVIVPALTGIVARYGRPDPAALAASLSGPVIDGQVAGPLADAICDFMDGAHDRAAHSIVPRLERVLRDIAVGGGIVVVREPDGSKPGGTRTLGPILAELDGVLPDDWRRYFANLLTDELGINLRNRVAHGLIDEVTREDAALLVHAAVALSLFRPIHADQPGAVPNDSGDA